MPRPATIRDDQILEAARALFLDRGFAASTADIAARAGVSEGSLFKRFPTKADLFLEAMDMGTIDDLLRFLDRLDPSADISTTIVQVVRRVVDKMRVLMPRMMMLWANVSPEQLTRGTTVPPPVRVLRGLTGWVEREVARGRLACAEPRVLARVLLGSSIHFVFFEMMGLETGGDQAADAFAGRLAETLLDGIRPSAGSAGSAGGQGAPA